MQRVFDNAFFSLLMANVRAGILAVEWRQRRVLSNNRRGYETFPATLMLLIMIPLSRSVFGE